MAPGIEGMAYLPSKSRELFSHWGILILTVLHSGYWKCDFGDDSCPVGQLYPTQRGANPGVQGHIGIPPTDACILWRSAHGGLPLLAGKFRVSVLNQGVA
jgi:hypothetical protein